MARACVSQATSVRVDGPLGVLGVVVDSGDGGGEGGEGVELRGGQAGVGRGVRVHGPGAAAGHRPDGGALVAHRHLDRSAGGGVEDEAVRVDRSGHDGLTQPGTGVDDQLPSVARDRVGGEHHSGHVGVDHQLHDHRQGDLGVVDALRGAVADGPLGPQRGPAASGGVQHRVGADHVEIRVLLTREAGPGQVLGGGRGAHRHRYVVAEGPIARRDGVGQVVGHRGGEDDLPGLLGRLALGDLAGPRESDQRSAQTLADDPSVRRGGDAETRRHGQVGPQHPTEVERLAADRREVLGTDVAEVDEVDDGGGRCVIHHTMNYPRPRPLVK